MKELENIKQERLDILLCNITNYSREFAKELIVRGDTFVDGKVIKKPGTKINTSSVITYNKPTTSYVSRAGYKIEKALSFFNLDITNKICADIGSSTGGFTDCLLQNGALCVYAIDSGKDQLAKSLANNPKVISLEKTNIKNITPFTVNTPCDFACIDVSFISLTKVLEPLAQILKDGCHVVALIKPQFELDKPVKTFNGVVNNKNSHIKVLKNIYSFALSVNFVPTNITFSPIKGSEGNIEYLMYMQYCTTAHNNIMFNLNYVENIVDEAFNIL
jgi:23S rRNA (cytidine1920-2'-O)/16S rRNA (cytidine1409-2'-O)-methyltransferase